MSGNGKIMCNHGVNLFKCQTCIDALLAEQINLMQQRITKLEQQLKTARAELVTQVLDKPAKVGAGTFGVGIKWSTVISAAQRQYEYANNLEGK